MKMNENEWKREDTALKRGRMVDPPTAEHALEARGLIHALQLNGGAM